MLISFPDGSPAARHLGRALWDHRIWCQRNGHSMPAELADLLSLLMGTDTATDRDRQVAPMFDAGAGAPDARGVTIRQAAVRLGLSVRTVERRVADGTLSSYVLGGRRVVDDARVVG